MSGKKGCKEAEFVVVTMKGKSRNTIKKKYSWPDSDVVLVAKGDQF